MLSGKLERREWQVVNKFFGSSASKKLKHLRLICFFLFNAQNVVGVESTIDSQKDFVKK